MVLDLKNPDTGMSGASASDRQHFGAPSHIPLVLLLLVVGDKKPPPLET